MFLFFMLYYLVGLKFGVSHNVLVFFFFSAPVYMGLNFTNTGDTTEVVAFVSPNKARFFTLSAEHFFGVEKIYIDVRGVRFSFFRSNFVSYKLEIML